MKSTIRIIAFTLAIFTAKAFAQTPLTPKDTPASQVLAQLVKDHNADQKAFDVKRQQAMSTLDQSNKTLSDQVAAMQKALMDDLNKDKKYKPRIDQINGMQQKLQTNGANANQAFQRDVGPLQQRVLTEQSQIDGLLPVIRKENGFADNAVFDPATGKWSEPKK